MTIYRTLLARGYFPKELPPGFYSEQFARYATSLPGRALLAKYKPLENYTSAVVYNLALPGHIRRELRILHPFSFAQLAGLVSKNLSRLLRLAAQSTFTKCRPIYAANRQRAIQPIMSQSNLAKERSAMRAGAAFVLKADLSQFYAALCTHAVGWAIDPKLRQKANWHKPKFLGARIEQALMDSSGKSSHGLPIGNDVSFLLAECVLALVDRATRFPKERSFRWYDDYEIAFDTREEAEKGLTKLRQQMDQFKLRLNPAKTRILELPTNSQPSWQHQLTLTEMAGARFRNANDVVRYFDSAFTLREQYPDSAVLTYAIGTLFKIEQPDADVGRIAQSCITQALLAEPGTAQKAFALLSLWELNGFSLNIGLIRDTICRIILRHQSRGASSDVAWALAFSIQHKIDLTKQAASVLCGFDDDSIILQAFHLKSLNLLRSGFTVDPTRKRLKNADLDRDHWLLCYESVRQGFLTEAVNAVNSNALFADMLSKKVTFYRTKLPAYAIVVHSGGAPVWVVRKWLNFLRKPLSPETKRPAAETFAKVERDVAELPSVPSTADETVEALLEVEMKKAGEVPALPSEAEEAPEVSDGLSAES